MAASSLLPCVHGRTQETNKPIEAALHSKNAARDGAFSLRSAFKDERTN